MRFGLEPIEENIMHQKPKDSKKGLFADGLWNKIFVEGFMIGIFTLFAFNLGLKLYGLEVGRTMAFVSLSMLELVHSFNIRSEESIFKIGIFKNIYLLGAFVIGTILQIAVIVIPFIANIFDVIPLNSTQWLYTMMISFTPILMMEMQKRLNEIRFGKVVLRRKEVAKL